MVLVADAMQARRALERASFDAWLLAVAVDDRLSLSFLEEQRRSGDMTPALVVVHGDDPTIASWCHRLDATCVFEPVSSRTIPLFVARLEPAPATPRADLHVVDLLAIERSLTIRESQVARLIASGTEREQLASRLKLSENTIKCAVRNLLKKTGHPSTQALKHSLVRQRIERSPVTGVQRCVPERENEGLVGADALRDAMVAVRERSQ